MCRHTSPTLVPRTLFPSFGYTSIILQCDANQMGMIGKLTLFERHITYEHLFRIEL